MGRGVSAGGGQSSLGYLFGSGETTNSPQPAQNKGPDSNNAPPQKPAAPSQPVVNYRNSSVLPISSSHTTDKSDAEEFEVNSVWLTDGGYEEDLGGYYFYARNSYRK